MRDTGPIRHSRQRGMGLVTAVFLLVVLAGLGVAMVSVFRAQQFTTALDIMGTRAYLAARAGAEWGIYRRRIDNSCAAATTFALPAGTSLAGFSVTVNCSQVTQAGLNRTRVIATSCNQPGPAGCPNPAADTNYVQRVVDVRFGD